MFLSAIQRVVSITRRQAASQTTKEAPPNSSKTPRKLYPTQKRLPSSHRVRCMEPSLISARHHANKLAAQRAEVMGRDLRSELQQYVRNHRWPPKPDFEIPRYVSQKCARLPVIAEAEDYVDPAEPQSSATRGDLTTSPAVKKRGGMTALTALAEEDEDEDEDEEVGEGDPEDGDDESFESFEGDWNDVLHHHSPKMSLSDAVVNEVLQGIDDIRAELDFLREENDALQAKSLQKDGDIRRITEDVQAHAKREQAALAELSSFRKQVASLQLEQEESNAHISRLLGRISTLEVHIEFGGGNLPLYRPPEWAAPGLATPPSSVRSTPTKGLGHLPSPKMLLVVDGESEALNDDDDEWERDRLDMIAQREAMMNGRTSRLGHFSNDVFFSS